MNGWLCYLAQCKPINRANLVSTVDAYLKAHRLTVVIIDQAMWPGTGLTGLTGQSPDSDKADRQERWGGGANFLDSSTIHHKCLLYLSLFNDLNSFIHSEAAQMLVHVKEIVSSNIQLLHAWRPSPTLNWFRTEREASLSTDTQPCFPHLPHPTQITPPSALPHHVARLPLSSLAASPLSSSPPLAVRLHGCLWLARGCGALAVPLICL